MRSGARAAVAGAVALAAACGGEDAAPVFPADHATTYQEVRNCRTSADHDLGRIRVLADPAARGPYLDRTAPFPDGAVVLKAEYDFGDVDCTGPITQWTAMQRASAAAERLGWVWQRVDRDRAVVSEDEPRCIGCHADCGVAPDGYLGTCAVP